jgi:hypothetical protein
MVLHTVLVINMFLKSLVPCTRMLTHSCPSNVFEHPRTNYRLIKDLTTSLETTTQDLATAQQQLASEQATVVQVRADMQSFSSLSLFRIRISRDARVGFQRHNENNGSADRPSRHAHVVIARAMHLDAHVFMPLLERLGTNFPHRLVERATLLEQEVKSTQASNQVTTFSGSSGFSKHFSSLSSNLCSQVCLTDCFFFSSLLLLLFFFLHFVWGSILMCHSGRDLLSSDPHFAVSSSGHPKETNFVAS